MQDTPSHRRARWYDQIGDMALALHLSRDLPPEIQSLIAQRLNEAIDEYRRRMRSDRNAMSLGQHRVLGLYKASQRNRWYDPHPDLYRAFNLMRTIPDGVLNELASRIVQLNEYVNAQGKLLQMQDSLLYQPSQEILLEDSDWMRIQERDGGIRIVTQHLPQPQAQPQQQIPSQPHPLADRYINAATRHTPRRTY